MSIKVSQIRTIALHLLFWIAVWFLYFYFFSYNSNDREYVSWFSSLLIPITIGVTYTVSYYLIPNLLLQRKYGTFLLHSFYLVLVSSYFIVILIYGVLIFIKKWDATNIPPMMKNFFFILTLVYLVAGIVGFISVLNRNFTTEKRNKELQNKILQTQLQLKDQELQYLKRQIHPHFLFNTLNTIYGFAMKQSRQTPEIILKLSNLLDYILYQVNKPVVPLSEEVAHIREYIDLEHIRFQDKLKISIETNNISEDLYIAPMLMIPFIENAFKHGSIMDDYLSIEIQIENNDQSLFFFVRNSFVPDQEKDNKGGIGLINIKKRLDLHYPGQYSLEHKIENDSYMVSLKIADLKQYV